MAIVAREPEEKAMTATMMDACVTGSVFISKANFSGRASGKGGDGRSLRERKELWTKTTTDVRAADSPWFIGVGENIVVRK